MSMNWTSAAAVVALCAAVAGTGSARPQDGNTGHSNHPADGGYHWVLPKGFPKPRVPADNPMTDAKVKLGRYLFYDERMSGNGTQSCSSCHQQQLAVTDGKPRGVGSTGELHSRGAMSLVNVAYSSVLTWGNPNEHSLEHQALTPMFGDNPVELGLNGDGQDFLDVLRVDPTYGGLFPAAFPGEVDPFTIGNVTKSLASFERTIISAALTVRSLPLRRRRSGPFRLCQAW